MSCRHKDKVLVGFEVCDSPWRGYIETDTLFKCVHCKLYTFNQYNKDFSLDDIIQYGESQFILFPEWDYEL